jgi:serine O-acetyltransferase
MSLKKLIFSDIERQFHLNGTVNKSPTVWSIIKNSFNPRFTPVLLWRISHHLYILGLTPLAKLVALLNFFLFGIEIGLRCEIGEGLYLPHTVGTVIGANKIGHNVIIFQGVTIGAKELDLDYQLNKRPSIGNFVVVGAGAKILGGIQVGNHVTIGANAVVTSSLPDNVVVAGIPARIIRSLNSDDCENHFIAS